MSEQNWSPYKKSLIWTVCSTAFWGSLRLGEILSEFTTQFDAGSSFLGSDLTLNNDGSMSFWLRNPKVFTSNFGFMVEIWPVPQNEILDPVLAVRHYLKLRAQFHGAAEELPFFLFENGRLLTTSDMNQNIKLLLSSFPFLQSSQDSWSGHSFRSGMSTMLEKLGFTEIEIKAWGRWHSSAYLRYLKDLSARRKVQARVTETFSRLLENINL